MVHRDQGKDQEDHLVKVRVAKGLGAKDLVAKVLVVPEGLLDKDQEDHLVKDLVEKDLVAKDRVAKVLEDRDLADLDLVGQDLGGQDQVAVEQVQNQDPLVEVEAQAPYLLVLSSTVPVKITTLP